MESVPPVQSVPATVALTVRHVPPVMFSAPLLVQVRRRAILSLTHIHMWYPRWCKKLQVSVNHKTIRLHVTLKGDAKNMYAIMGSAGHPLAIPAAYQVTGPANKHVGGIDPAFWLSYGQIDAQFDSWLTVGITDGDPNNRLSIVGLNMTTWTATQGISNSDCSVFWMDPRTTTVVAGSTSAVVAQLTVPKDYSGIATMGLSGNKNDGNMWRENDVVFTIV